MDDVPALPVRRRDLLALAGAALIATVEASDGAVASAVAQQTATGLRLKRIDNMDIYTRNLPRLVDFYPKTLGLRKVSWCQPAIAVWSHPNGTIRTVTRCT